MGDFLSCSVVAEIDEVVTGERASCLLQPTTRNKAAEVDGIRNDTFLSRETALRRCQQGSQIRGTPSSGGALGVRRCPLCRSLCSTTALPACGSCVGLAGPVTLSRGADIVSHRGSIPLGTKGYQMLTEYRSTTRRRRMPSTLRALGASAAGGHARRSGAKPCDLDTIGEVV